MQLGRALEITALGEIDFVAKLINKWRVK